MLLHLIMTRCFQFLRGLSLKELENCNDKDTASLGELSNDDLKAKDRSLFCFKNIQDSAWKFSG